jgi:hypothetical protein
MLMMLGAVIMDVWPFNPTETDREAGGDYVEKAVMGRSSAGSARSKP